jgi:hypothetical protein
MIAESKKTFLHEKLKGKSEEACLESAIIIALKTQYGEKISQAILKSNKKGRRNVSEKDRQARLINLAKARAARLEAKSKKVSVEEAPEIKKSNESIATSLLRDLLNQHLLLKFASFRR